MPTPLLPVSPEPISFKITSKVKTLKSESLSGKILTRKIGGQRFEATLVYPPMTRTQFSAIHAFLMEQAGMSGVFYIKLPVFGSAAGATGEYYNYSTHSKLYMTKSDGGDYPAKLVAGGTAEINNVFMRVSLKSDVQVIEYGRDGLVRFEIDVMERI